MKSLSLSRPVVILMVGVPGSGKSFFARQFSEMFGAPLVSIDHIRTELFEQPGFSVDEERIVSRIAGLMHDQLFMTRRSFIIDGGMNSRVARYDVMRQAKQRGYDTLTIWVQTDERTSLARSLNRSPANEYDELNPPLTAEQYHRQSKLLTAPVGRQNLVVISGKHTFAAQARIVLKRLAPSRDQQPDSSRQLPRTAPTEHDGSRPHRVVIQ